MTANKTQATGADVGALLDAIPDPQQREDARAVCALMTRLSGEEPAVWGETMVGFGRYRYRYESGREGEWFIAGFAPRASALTLYIMPGFARYQELLDRLGKHRLGKSCLYIKRLADVDAAVLEELVAHSIAHMRATHDTGRTDSPRDPNRIA